MYTEAAEIPPHSLWRLTSEIFCPIHAVNQRYNC